MVQLFWWKILFLETPIPNFFRTNTRSRRRGFVGVRRVECISLISATWQTHWHISPCCSLAFAFRPLFLCSGIGKAHRWSRSKLYIVFNTLNEGPPSPLFCLSREREERWEKFWHDVMVIEVIPVKAYWKFLRKAKLSSSFFSLLSESPREQWTSSLSSR